MKRDEQFEDRMPEQDYLQNYLPEVEQDYLPEEGGEWWVDVGVLLLAFALVGFAAYICALDL